MARKAAVSKNELEAPANLDPALTHFIVCDFGDWAIGATIHEAVTKIPFGKRTKLEPTMQVWHVAPGTFISASGEFWNHECRVKPVLNESRRKNR
jgi:hypothetical protein